MRKLAGLNETGMQNVLQNDKHIVSAQQTLAPLRPSHTEVRRDEQQMLAVQG